MHCALSTLHRKTKGDLVYISLLINISLVVRPPTRFNHLIECSVSRLFAIVYIFANTGHVSVCGGRG